MISVVTCRWETSQRTFCVSGSENGASPQKVSEVGSGLAPRARTHLRRALDRLGVSVHPKTFVAAVREDGLDTRDGPSFAADAVVWTTGFRAPELARAALDLAPEPLVLLVFGGSLGARSINLAILAILPELLA